MMDKGRGVKIPKLDLSSIYIVREAPPSGKDAKKAEDHQQHHESESSMTEEELFEDTT